MTYHRTLIRMANIKTVTINAGTDAERLDHRYTGDGKVKQYSHNG